MFTLLYARNSQTVILTSANEVIVITNVDANKAGLLPRLHDSQVAPSQADEITRQLERLGARVSHYSK